MEKGYKRSYVGDFHGPGLAVKHILLAKYILQLKHSQIITPNCKGGRDVWPSFEPQGKKSFLKSQAVSAIPVHRVTTYS